MQNIIDYDSVGSKDGLGNYTDFRVNNTFYLLAPQYYYTFYATYLRKCLQIYDGWDSTWHNLDAGLCPEGLASVVSRGLTNMLFAHGIDYIGDGMDYKSIVEWSNKTDFFNVLKKGHLFAEAGGTSLLKLNRKGKDIYATAHRIDTFYPDIDVDGKILSIKVYFDLIENINGSKESDTHYGICEERYFNEEGQACVKCSVYQVETQMQNKTLARPNDASDREVKWENLPPKVRRYITRNYPSILIGKEQLLPFAHSLGCVLLKFTDCIPKLPDSYFGQPIGDIIRTECYQFDQLKCFEKNEVYLAKARALIPEEMWNKDDPNYDQTAMRERFFQKVQSLGNDSDKVTPIQFLLRANEIRTQKENIYRDVSAKLNVSASSVASFLSEGSGAKTATEIVNERTKSDTWISSQIKLLSPSINELLNIVSRYYNHGKVTVIFKSEDQMPLLETVKTYTDMFSQGAISPSLFVSLVHKHLTEEQQAREVKFLQEQSKLKASVVQSYAQQTDSVSDKPSADESEGK